MASINFPAGVKIRGENITSVYPSGSSQASISGTPDQWAAGWPDLRKAICYSAGIGCNAIRMVGDMGFVHSGTITQAQYDARWSTLLDFTDSLGLYVYPCMQGGDQIALESLTISDMITSASASLAAMAGRARIVGVDLVNEGNNGTLSTGDAGTLLDGVRANGTAFALTCSTYEKFLTQPSWYNSVEPHTDFSDFHVYRANWGTAPTQSDITNGPFTWWGNKSILFGEFGDPKSQGTTNNSAWLNSCITALNVPSAGGSSIAWGGWHWNIYDQSAVSSVQYGSFDTSWGAYTAFIFPLANASGTAAAPSAPSAPKVVENATVVSNPIGCTTDYSAMKMYRDGVLIATNAQGVVDDYANLSPNITYSYTAKVASGSHGDSADSPSTRFSIPSSSIAII